MEFTKRIGLLTWGNNESEVRDYLRFNAPNIKLILQNESQDESNNNLKQYFFEAIMPVDEFENIHTLKDVQIVNGYVKDEDLDEAIVTE